MSAVGGGTSSARRLDAQADAAHVCDMPKRSSKPEPEKNPAAVALGRLGGLKGGKARAEALSAKRRKEIARKAAEKRWGTKT
jgi:hypothetical protein